MAKVSRRRLLQALRKVASLRFPDALAMGHISASAASASALVRKARQPLAEEEGLTLHTAAPLRVRETLLPPIVSKRPMANCR